MRVEKLTLQSYNLQLQQAFYVETLGFELIEKSNNSFSVQIGKSILTFKKSSSNPYYHFAFNITPFLIDEAINWAAKKVRLLKFNDKVLVDFKNWNAKACYFFDPDQNIVELIDRRKLGRFDIYPFSEKSIFEISEIGLSVKDISSTFQKLNELAGIQKYSGDLERFCAAGDEHGLFIIVNQKDKNWLPTNLPAKAFPFELAFSNEQEKYFLKYDGTEIVLEKNRKEDVKK